jgi:hypothetical protein
MAVPFFFDQHQLVLFNLDADNLNAESAKKQYMKYILQHHPDKGGTKDMFVHGNSVYHELLDGLNSFGVWRIANPGVTLAQTIRMTPRLPRGSSSAAQPAPPASGLVPAPVLAPSFLAGECCHLFPSLEEALQQMHFSFDLSWADMANRLKRTPVGKSVTFYISGAVQPEVARYHGTHFSAMIAISKSGFLPVWGAGRGTALAKFREDLPVVYTAPDPEQASWYPMAMVGAKGRRVGEFVCLDSIPMRVILICSAADDTKRIKIRRKQNKQDAWLPKDIKVCGVIFRMMEDAINQPTPTHNPEARAGVWCQYPVSLESSDEESDHQGESSAAQPGEFESEECSSDESDSSSEPLPTLPKKPRLNPPPAGSVPLTTPPPTTAAQRGRERAHDIKVEKQIRGLVARQCMLLRIHKDDRRSHADTAFDYAQLVHLRHQYVERNCLEWEAPLSPEDQKKIWKEELYWLFESCRPENCGRTMRQLHSVFRVWQRESFGCVHAIRDILRNPCCWATWREIQFRQNLMTADPNIKP